MTTFGPEDSQSGTYRRIVVTRHGGPEVLQLVEAEQPEPGPGEVRVRVLLDRNRLAATLPQPAFGCIIPLKGTS